MTNDARSAPTPQVCWYGDDFTGATDTLAEVARAGLRSLLFLGVPSSSQLERVGPLDAIGIAGAARGMAPAEMVEELRAVGAFMASTGARVLHYKCCSTFDSAPHVGSIGVAVRELRRHFANPIVPIVGGQPSIGRYCSFGNLFARAGSAPEIHRIDRHPVMSVHPVTPMHEADLRRHLEAQGLEGVRSVPHVAYPSVLGANWAANSVAGSVGNSAADSASSSTAFDAWIDEVTESANGPLLLDLVDESQLAMIGRLIQRAASRAPLLAVGPSSVQQALARARSAEHSGAAPATPLGPANGPVLVVAGSLSPVTARQIAACESYTRQPLQVERLLSDADYAAQQVALATVTLAGGRNVLVHTDKPTGTVNADQTAATARGTAKLAADIVRASAKAGHRLNRIGIAGGDTSSQATLALGLWGLAFRCVLAPGVTVSVARSDDPVTDGVELMLKGGQMGGDRLFDALAAGNG
ncbi:four-carbon acid sugar kinase family protein [Achromobacter animicus]|uniref:four-carbon acid sugar kinase family protein n=1 Tax=Achromobacter animicus TaxID=1389935 RepID=UPI0024477886|nr:four-carbon acid sugar kinase family protein [Achromobacter animicus]MDH0682374.1 four-carbon acid sugar kinase family protein [Achromobacter animicus]